MHLCDNVKESLGIILCARSLNEPQIKMMGVSWLEIIVLGCLNDKFGSELNIIWAPFASALSSPVFSIF